MTVQEALKLYPEAKSVGERAAAELCVWPPPYVVTVLLTLAGAYYELAEKDRQAERTAELSAERSAEGAPEDQPGGGYAGI